MPLPYADLKNDFVFRRIFATHPDILQGLLNDLLERTGDQQIVSIEYLPSEQLPLVEGAKLSILDVRCKDQSGRMFIVEMQLIHIAGFINRVVYNGCKAYANQLKKGDPYTKLVDVIAISICDFELWPDAVQDAKQEPRVPMLSHYSMRERHSGNQALLQVQYAFLELPKVPKEKPEGGAALWAWLFANAPKLDKIIDVPVGPVRDALELAKEATFTDLEMEAYFKVDAEIWQARQYGEDMHEKGLKEGRKEGRKEGLKEGLKEGRKEGLLEGRRDVLFRILQRGGITLNDAETERIVVCKDVVMLEKWLDNAFDAKSAAEVFR